MTDEKTRTPLTEEQKQRRRVGRKIGHAIFTQQFSAENAGATGEERKAAWKAARKAHTKLGLRVLKQIERAGFTITPPQPETQAAE